MVGQCLQPRYVRFHCTNVSCSTGNYVSYLDESSKESRRERWKNLNFAGTIDWAVDLQRFSEADKELPERPKSGKGCIEGEDLSLDTWDLCTFTCAFGFCPESRCECTLEGDLLEMPVDMGDADIEAWDPTDVEITRLCKFSCKYGYCPDWVCFKPEPDIVENEDGQIINEFNDGSQVSKRDFNQKACTLWRGDSPYDNSDAECKKACKA